MKTIPKLKEKILALFVIILFSSCLTNVDEEIEIEGQDPTAPDPCATVSFATDVKPIIDANCVSCHSTGGQFPNLESYQSISANAVLVQSEVVAKTMPIGGSLTDAEIQAISCWVDNGALDN